MISMIVVGSGETVVCSEAVCNDISKSFSSGESKAEQVGHIARNVNEQTASSTKFLPLDQMKRMIGANGMHIPSENPSHAKATTSGTSEENNSDERLDGCKSSVATERSGDSEHCKVSTEDVRKPENIAVTLRASTRKRSGRQPVTPRIEEPRAVRANRGMKRRFPGDESDDNGAVRKRTRVRSITKVCDPVVQSSTISEGICKGKISSVSDGKEPARGKWREHQAKDFMHSVLRADKSDDSTSTVVKIDKRKITELGLANGSKGPRHSQRGAIYVCNVEGCEKLFSDAVALYNHGRVHGDRPYVCHYDGCTKRFSERSKLKRHFLIHTGEKPFICRYEGCGKAFSLDFNLRSHMKTHTGEYHECPHTGCEKRYCQEYKLRAHICKEHKSSINTADIKGSLLQDGASTFSSNDKVAKQKERVEQLGLKRGKLEKCKEVKKKRVNELAAELERETKELAKLEKALRKLVREQDLVDLEEYTDQDFASDHTGEEELGEVYGEEREVVMFAHKLPTADQGARLMDQVVLTQPLLSPCMSVCSPPFLLSRVCMDSLHQQRPSHLLPYSLPANLCLPPGSNAECNPLSSYEIQKKDFGFQIGENRLSTLGELSSGHFGNGLSRLNNDLTSSHSIALVHAEQVSQSEPPVSQLFTCQEQPCLAD